MNTKLAALDFIAGCLSVRDDDSHNKALLSDIESGRCEWQLVIAMANAELVTPALWVALRDRLLASCLPLDVHEYLVEIHRLNKIRNVELKAQTTEAVKQLNAIGIEPLLLKGAVALFAGPFADPGLRVLMDVDILVPKSAARDCWDMLQQIGYRPNRGRQTLLGTGEGRVDYNRHQHFQPLYRTGDYGTVEIHRTAVPKSSSSLLPDDLIWRNAERIREGGATMYIPAPTKRVLHNLVHAAVVDEAYVRGKVPLRPLHELAQMQIRYGDLIEWKSIRDQFCNVKQLNAFRSMLYLGRKFLAIPVAEGMNSSVLSAGFYIRVRLQTRWDWLQKLIERVLWFRSSQICERYECGKDLLSVTKGRMCLASTLVTKVAVRAIRWIVNRFRINSSEAENY
jgi:hypothetical protein